MSQLAGLKGMRHIALKVTDVARSKSFYRDILGMEIVWEPDPQNAYLSSGCDNIERVKELEEAFRARGVTIVHPFKLHRDGSASFYCADPDGIMIQMLYEPKLSLQGIR